MKVKCDGCQRILRVPDNSAGLLVQCGRCGKKVRIPQAAAGAAAGDGPVAPETGNDESAANALYQALMDQAAREGRGAAASAPSEEAAPELEPELEPPEPGKIAPRKEIRVSDAGVKSGYAVADEPPPPVFQASQPGAQNSSQPNALLKVIAGAFVLLLVIGLIAAIVSRLSKPSSGDTPITTTGGSGGGSVTPVPPPTIEPFAQTLPAGLKDVVSALAANMPLWVEVVNADSGEPAKPLVILTPSGDLAMDVMNVHIRGKDSGDAGLSQMRANVASAISESVAEKLRARGLTVMDAARPTPGMDSSKAASRLQIGIRTTPVFAQFDFAECRPLPAALPSATGAFAPPAPAFVALPPRTGRPPRTRRPPGILPGGAPGVSAAPVVEPFTTVPVKLWETLLAKSLALSARCVPDAREAAAPNWIAVSSDDPRTDPVPCGLRVSIVRVFWEIGERTLDLTPHPAPADAASGGADSAEPGVSLPFRRPEALRGFQFSAKMAGAHACVLSGFCQYDDVDMLCGAAAAGELVAGLLPSPETEWRAVWNAANADRASLVSAWRSVLRLGGGQAVADLLAAQPNCVPAVSGEVLVSVLKEDRNSAESVRPFLVLHGVCADAALCGLASRARDRFQKDYAQWCAAPPGQHSAESVQAACCALIDIGQPGADVDGLIEGHRVTAFPFVRVPQGSMAFAPSLAETILTWLIRDGTPAQKLGAVSAAANGNVVKLRALVEGYAQRSAGSDADSFAVLCRTLKASQSPLAFDVLATVAHQKLTSSDIGDRLAPPPVGSAAPALAGRFSHTVAALVCADLAGCNKVKAGEVLLDLLRSPGPATRITVIETLMALDYVDGAEKVRLRWAVLDNNAKRTPYEALEWTVLKEAKDKLCRYEGALTKAGNLLRSAEGFLEQGQTQRAYDLMTEAVKIYRQVIAENPSPKVVQAAREALATAEKQQAEAGGPP